MAYIKLFKLTTSDNFTRQGVPGETKWEVNKWVTASGTGGLCTNGVIHAYRSPLLAVLLNPAHASIGKPTCWLAEGTRIVEEKADKIGVKILRIKTPVVLPYVTTEQKVRFAIGVALEWCHLDYREASFRKWAIAWLDGSDRSTNAATAAAYAAAATYAAAYAATAAATINAANAATAAAYAATYAAAYAATSALHLSPKRLQKIAEWALTNSIEPLRVK